MNDQPPSDLARREYAGRFRREINMRLAIIFLGLALGYGAWLAVRAIKVLQRGEAAPAAALER